MPHSPLSSGQLAAGALLDVPGDPGGQGTGHAPVSTPLAPGKRVKLALIIGPLAPVLPMELLRSELTLKCDIRQVLVSWVEFEAAESFLLRDRVES